jgi:hypothetical protein
MSPMSALSQAGLLSECLERQKGQFKLTAFGAVLWFAVGMSIPIHAQEAPASITRPTPQEEPRRLQNGGQAPQAGGARLDLALEAIERQKELIAALESRVKELEQELADCKAQRQSVAPSH